jgi:hypothetical protein
MNVSSVKTKEYENKRLFRRGEKQTQSNPTCSELVEPIANQPPHFLDFLSFFLPFFVLLAGTNCDYASKDFTFAVFGKRLSI